MTHTVRKHSLRSTLTTLAVCATLSVAAAGAAGGAAPRDAAAFGVSSDRAAELVRTHVLAAADGRSFRIADLKGVTVVNFWASWCAPCREEMPSLAKLAIIMKDRKDVAFVTVSVDEDTSAVKDTLRVLIATDPEAKEALGDGPIPFAVLLDPEQKVVRDLYGTTMYPETWVIDAKGYVRMRYDGAFDWASAVAIDAIQSPQKGPGCLADFAVSRPVGPFASLCDSE